jgi:XRCC1 N terminal domain
MRKSIIDAPGARLEPHAEQEWLDLERVARVEVTSEDPNFPVESALVSGTGAGWRAARKGEQIIRIIFDEPRAVRRIRLEFSETAIARTQEFTLRWSAEPSGPFREIVRQQWSFSPNGSTSEVENYQANLDRVSILELALKPDLTPGNALASLTRLSLK